jgi:hypothetical protein
LIEAIIDVMISIRCGAGNAAGLPENGVGKVEMNAQVAHTQIFAV